MVDSPANVSQSASPDTLGPLIPIDIQSFRNTTKDINFDIYLKLSEDNPIHVFSKTTGLDYKRLAQYMQKGVRELYIRKEDEESFKVYLARPTDAIFNDPKVSNEKKIATLLNMTEQNMAELFVQFKVLEETASNTQRVIKNYVNIMTEQPKTLALILKLASHGEYLYYHSIAVSIFSMLISKACGQFNQRTLELIGLGGFLHDVGYTRISKEILSSPHKLTSTQWEQVRSHPRIGLRMIENTPNIPDEVRYIVYQHHEEPSGRGYPNGLQSKAIYYPAKIVAIADAFSALISKRPYRPAHTVEHALHILQSETGKYDRDLVQIVTTMFMRQANVRSAA